MSKSYDKYIVSNTVAPVGKSYDKYISSPNKQGDSWPALIGKSALKGITSLADIPRIAGEAVEGVYNAGAKMRGAPSGAYGMGLRPFTPSLKPNIYVNENVPQTNYASRIPTSGDAYRALNNYTGINLEPNPASSAQRIASHAAQFASPAGMFGLASKGAGLLNKFKNAADLAKTGAAIGATSGIAQEAGVNPLVADIGASVANPAGAIKRTANTFRHPIQSYNNLERKAFGLSPDKLKLDVAQAARNSGVDLPASALTDSKFTALTDQLVSKTPYFGDKLKKKYEFANEQLKNRLENIYESVGPKKTDEVRAEIAAKYAKAENALPKEAGIVPNKTLQTIKDIEKIRGNTVSASKGERELFGQARKIKEGLISNQPSLNAEPKKGLALTELDLGKFSPAVKKMLEAEGVQSSEIPASVAKLLGTKKSLNSTIKWNEDAGAKNILKQLQKSLNEDIETYGKTNPQWYTTYQDAEKYYADVAKRKGLEELLSGKGINYANESVNHAALSKAIHSPKNEILFKNLVDSKTFADISDIGKISKAMAQKGVNNPNPSGTAPTAAIGSFIVSFVADPTKVVTPLVTLLGTARATKLLTDKKFIDNAVKFAENPNNIATSTSLNERIKKITGFSAISLNNELSKEINKERQDGLQ